MLAVMRLLSKTIPEENLMEMLTEKLKNYALTGNAEDRPIGELLMLIMKWTDEDKDAETILKDSTRIESMAELDKEIQDSLKKDKKEEK